MGLFYNNDVAGTGVEKNAPKKKPFFKFWEVFLAKFWVLIQINAIYFLFCIPIITFGPATAAMTSIMRNIYLEKPQFIFHDFWVAFKKNFKQSFIIGLFDVAVISIAAFAYIFYSSNLEANDYYWFFYALTMAAEIVFLVMNFYIYPQIVALNLRMTSILKNSLILTFVNIKGLLGVLVVILYTVAIMFFGVTVLLMAPILPFAWISIVSTFTCYPAIQKFIINPYYESIGQKNPEIPEYEESPDVVFEDMGGKEAPINLKKDKNSGKVIK